MHQKDQPLISLVIPVWNEAESLRPLFGLIKRSIDGLAYDFEFIFVDDGSSDNSLSVLQVMQARNKAIRIIEFSRNFGKEIAITAGVHASAGRAVLMLDADMQHPPALIPEFIRKWEAGAEVVVGVRQDYGRTRIWKRLTSWLFYKMTSRMSHAQVMPHATDFRLIDRQVVNAFNTLNERNRMTRGLIDWLGFKRDYIYFTPPPREFGQPGYSFHKLFGLAVNSFVSLSVFPLRVAGYLGICITAFAGVAGAFMLVEDVILGDPLGLNFSGPAMLAVLNMFWIGVVLSALGLVALYIASIHAEVVNRPLYIIRNQPVRRVRK